MIDARFAILKTSYVGPLPKFGEIAYNLTLQALQAFRDDLAVAVRTLDSLPTSSHLEENMVSNRRIVIERSESQQAVRDHLGGVEFDEAISIAVKALFRFSHRAKGAKALWSRAHCVWLGRSTFMHWSMKNEEIDIPWCVAKAKNAPRNKEKLVELVQAELTSHFAYRLSQLPKRSPGCWLPLP